MESFRDSVIERVKRPVVWFQENLKDKVASATANTTTCNTTPAPTAVTNNNHHPRHHPQEDKSQSQENRRAECEVSQRQTPPPHPPHPHPVPTGHQSTTMSAPCEPIEEKVVCHQTAKRRLAYQKSYSLEHGANWRRRSLIEDARFDTVTNAEFERQERASVSDDGNEVFSTVVENGEHVHSEPDKPEVAAAHRKCTLIFSVRDMNALSRVFKTFENSRAVIQHVESRRSRKKGSQYEFLINFEAGKEDLQTVILALKSSSAVTDVVIVSEKDAVEESVPWFPRHISDLDNCTHLLTKFDPDLDYDHPGFADKEYRERRKTIASLAFDFKSGMPIQTVEYQLQEIQTWGTVYHMLQKVYPQHACKEQIRNIRLLERECGYSPQHIPQLQDVSNFLKRKTGFQLRPVAGLLTARDFLASLAFRVFQCTQYIRHSSKPDHTVEPDCVHELLGHVPMLADPTFAQFSQEIGLASLGVSDADIEKFSTLYWFTVEFGLCRQDGEIKAYGAGLLSAFGELHHAMSDVPEVRTFEPEKAAIQPYQDQDYQMVYYVADSFDDMREKVRQWSSQLKRPYTIRYDPYTQSIQLLNNRNSVQEVTRVLKAEITNLHNALDKIESINLK